MTASHQRELQVAGNLHGHGRGEGIHVEEINAVGDAVFDDHALRIALDEHFGRFFQLVGEEQGGPLMTQFGDGNLPDGTCVV